MVEDYFPFLDGIAFPTPMWRLAHTRFSLAYPRQCVCTAQCPYEVARQFTAIQLWTTCTPGASLMVLPTMYAIRRKWAHCFKSFYRSTVPGLWWHMLERVHLAIKTSLGHAHLHLARFFCALILIIVLWRTGNG